MNSTWDAANTFLHMRNWAAARDALDALLVAQRDGHKWLPRDEFILPERAPEHIADRVRAWNSGCSNKRH